MVIGFVVGSGSPVRAGSGQGSREPGEVLSGGLQGGHCGEAGVHAGDVAAGLGDLALLGACVEGGGDAEEEDRRRDNDDEGDELSERFEPVHWCFLLCPQHSGRA